MSYISLAQISGDVTISNGISTIGANRVTLAMLATIPNNTVLLNVSGGAAVPIAGTGANVRTICGLATTDTPTFAGLTLTNLAALTTPAESWVGPSSTAGIYFKGGNVGIGTTGPVGKLSLGIDGAGVVLKTWNTASQATLDAYTIAGAPYDRTLDISVIGNSNGTAGGGIIRFITNPVTSNTGVEAMRIDKTGNVGIGTTGPWDKLVVDGASASTGGYSGISLNNNEGNNTSYTGLTFGVVGLGVGTYQKGGIFFQRTGSYGVGNLIFANNSASDSTNVTVSNAVMTILSGGNVGIGTTSPRSKLSVVGLPTSASGLTSGDIWCDTTGGLNILKIV